MNPKFVAAAVVAFLAIASLQCAIYADHFRSCARLVFVDSGLWALHFAALALAVWIGVEVDARIKKTWLSWITGIVVLASAAAALSYLGFEVPKSDLEAPSDFNYRR